MSPEIENTTPEYKEIEITRKEPAWCIDGRAPVTEVNKGPQMLGGSLHLVVLKALAEGKPVDEDMVASVFSDIKKAGFELGVHTDTHAHDGIVGCGFAQNLEVVLNKARSQKVEITRRLHELYEKNKVVLGEKDFAGIIDSSYEKITNYSLENLKLTGDALVSEGERMGAVKNTLTGDHEEVAAFINMKHGVSYDTSAQAPIGHQAFNLDMWAVLEQAKACGIDDNVAIGASLILVLSAEMVLVEDKGKPAVPVIFHS